MSKEGECDRFQYYCFLFASYLFQKESIVNHDDDGLPYQVDNIKSEAENNGVQLLSLAISRKILKSNHSFFLWNCQAFISFLLLVFNAINIVAVKIPLNQSLCDLHLIVDSSMSVHIYCWPDSGSSRQFGKWSNVNGQNAIFGIVTEFDWSISAVIHRDFNASTSIPQSLTGYNIAIFTCWQASVQSLSQISVRFIVPCSKCSIAAENSDLIVSIGPPSRLWSMSNDISEVDHVGDLAPTLSQIQRLSQVPSGWIDGKSKLSRWSCGGPMFCSVLLLKRNEFIMRTFPYGWAKAQAVAILYIFGVW